MVNLYVVMVHDNLGKRWADSYWVGKMAAEKRASIIRDSMVASGLRVNCNDYWAWSLEAQIEDAAAPEKDAKP